MHARPTRGCAAASRRARRDGARGPRGAARPLSRRARGRTTPRAGRGTPSRRTPSSSTGSPSSSGRGCTPHPRVSRRSTSSSPSSSERSRACRAPRSGAARSTRPASGRGSSTCGRTCSAARSKTSERSRRKIHLAQDGVEERADRDRRVADEGERNPARRPPTSARTLPRSRPTGEAMRTTESAVPNTRPRSSGGTRSCRIVWSSGFTVAARNENTPNATATIASGGTNDRTSQSRHVVAYTVRYVARRGSLGPTAPKKRLPRSAPALPTPTIRPNRAGSLNSCERVERDQHGAERCEHEVAHRRCQQEPRDQPVAADEPPAFDRVREHRFLHRDFSPRSRHEQGDHDC